jgi:hypothetical protein
MCTVLLPLGDNPIAVNKNISYKWLYEYCCLNRFYTSVSAMLLTTLRTSHLDYNGHRYVLVDKDFWRCYIWPDIAVLCRREIRRSSLSWRSVNLTDVCSWFSQTFRANLIQYFKSDHNHSPPYRFSLLVDQLFNHSICTTAFLKETISEETDE